MKELFGYGQWLWFIVPLVLAAVFLFVSYFKNNKAKKLIRGAAFLLIAFSVFVAIHHILSHFYPEYF